MASLYHRFGSFYSSSFSRRPWLTLAVANSTLGVIADSLAQSFEKYDERRESIAAAKESESEGSLGKVVEKVKGLGKQQDVGTTAPVWDWNRTGRFWAFGVGMAPLLAEWNKFLEFQFPLRVGSAASSASTTTAATAAAASTGAVAAAKGSMAATNMAATAANLGKVSFLQLGKRLFFDQVLFAPFGLACFVGTMGALEHGSWEGVKQKFSDMYTPALIANWQIWPAIQLFNFRFVPLRYRVPFTSSCGIAWTLYLSLLQAAKGELKGGQEADKREVPGT